jgi:hypothetical protein
MVALAAAPGPAAADGPFVAGLRDPLPEVHLSSGSVVYVDSRVYRSSDSGQYVVFSRAPGRPQRLLARVVPRRLKHFGWPDLDFAIASSKAATVVAKQELYNGPDEDAPALEVRTLTASGAAGRVILHTRCTHGSASLDVALSGATLASFGCDGTDLVVRDLSHAGRVVQRFTDTDGGEAPVDIAGDYVAFASHANRLVVANWRTGATLYEAERDGLNLYSFSLAPDGTVAIASEACGVVLFDRDTPAGRDLPLHLCEPTLRLVGRTLAFADGTRLELADVDTGERRVMARLGGSDERGFDFDGEHFAWQEQRCADYAIFLRGLDGPAHPAAPAECPVRLGKVRSKVSRRGIVRVPFSCPLGCTIEEASLVTPRGYAMSPPVSPRARPHVQRVMRLRLFPEDLARLRRRSPMQARLEVTSYLPGGKRVNYRRRLLLR